jgi:peroxiredoxin
MTQQTGQKAMPFTLPGVDGSDHSLADYDDKEALVVIFSCNHCPYVQAWEDRMVDVQAKYADKGVQLIAISSNDSAQYPEDGFPQMKERARQKGFNFPYLFDESQQVSRAYSAERTPEVFLYDRQRELRYHGTIDDNYDDPAGVQKHYLRDALDAVLAGRTPGVMDTKPVGCTIKWKAA